MGPIRKTACGSKFGSQNSKNSYEISWPKFDLVNFNKFDKSQNWKVWSQDFQSISNFDYLLPL